MREVEKDGRDQRQPTRDSMERLNVVTLATPRGVVGNEALYEMRDLGLSILGQMM